MDKKSHKMKSKRHSKVRCMFYPHFGPKLIWDTLITV